MALEQPTKEGDSPVSKNFQSLVLTEDDFKKDLWARSSVRERFSLCGTDVQVVTRRRGRRFESFRAHHLFREEPIFLGSFLKSFSSLSSPG